MLQVDIVRSFWAPRTIRSHKMVQKQNSRSYFLIWVLVPRGAQNHTKKPFLFLFLFLFLTNLRTHEIVVVDSTEIVDIRWVLWDQLRSSQRFKKYGRHSHLKYSVFRIDIGSHGVGFRYLKSPKDPPSVKSPLSYDNFWIKIFFIIFSPIFEQLSWEVLLEYPKNVKWRGVENFTKWVVKSSTQYWIVTPELENG